MNQIKERPILFAAPMVRAILEGRKTVTRRALNAQSLKNIGYGVQLGECHELPSEGPLHPNSIGYYTDFCPFGQPGDRLWVRETTEADHANGAVLSRYAADRVPVLYAGCGDPEYNGSVAHWNYPRRSRPSIHMQRWACRILLEITDVRVERLQDISTDQALAEGIQPFGDGNGYHVEQGQFYTDHPYESFAGLWQSINGEDSWSTNPWVWVVEFKRVTP